MSLLWRLQVCLGPAQGMVGEQDAAGAPDTPSAFHPGPAPCRAPSQHIPGPHLWCHQHSCDSITPWTEQWKQRFPPCGFAAWKVLSAQPGVSMRHPNKETALLAPELPAPKKGNLSIKNCFHVFLYPNNMQVYWVVQHCSNKEGEMLRATC